MATLGKVIEVSDARRKLNATNSTTKNDQIDLRIVWPLVQWVRDQRGEIPAAELARAAGVRGDELRGGSRWVGYESFTSLLETARAMMPDDETFRTACTYRLAEAYGPLRFVTWALSPAFVFRKAIGNIATISRAHRAEVVSAGPNFVRCKYTATVREHRLSCLSRMAQAEMLPSMWGLPRAQLIEHKCEARGDDCCEYELHWTSPGRWKKVLLVAFASGVVCDLVFGNQDWNPPSWLLGGTIGLMLAHASEIRRERAEQYLRTDQMQAAMRGLAIQEAETRRELVALSERESAWNAMLEREVQSRTERLGEMVESLNKLQADRVVTLRGYTHDLKNPLSVLKAAGYYLEPHLSQLGQEGKELLLDHMDAVASMERLISEVVSLANATSNIVQVNPVYVNVAELTAEVRRRLSALAFGRGLKTNAQFAREAPENIQADTLILDRIIDNLLTNAVKYTTRGSIAVEFDRAGDFILMKLSDTGRGISESAMTNIFVAGGSDKSQRSPGSHGIGLSVVVHLLDIVGGRMEIMSNVDVGTTFWVYFPILITSGQPNHSTSGNAADVIGRVVHIRKETPV